jgi:hypothetical protein
MDNETTADQWETSVDIKDRYEGVGRMLIDELGEK